MAKNPDFLTMLLRYSCLTNETLSHKYDLEAFKPFKKRSYVTCAKDSTQLMAELVQENKLAYIFSKKGTMVVNKHKKNEKIKHNEQQKQLAE